MAVITVHPKPGLKARLLFVFMLVFVKPLLTLWPVFDRALRALDRLERSAESSPDVSGTNHKRITLGGRPTELVTAADGAADGDTAVLYLHGGGFIACGPNTHRQGTGPLARALRLPTYVVDYRQLPEGGVGTSVEDAVNAYRELLSEHGYRRIIVAGDSAGGYLCGKVIEQTHARRLPKPVAYIGFSPLLDLDLGARTDRTSRHDAYIPKRKLVQLGPKFYRGPVAFPGASSIIDVSAEAFPPTILLTAQDELLEPDAIDLTEKLSAAGISVQLHSFPWALHAFPVMGGPITRAPEGIAIVADFARETLVTEEDTPAERVG